MNKKIRYKDVRSSDTVTIIGDPTIVDVYQELSSFDKVMVSQIVKTQNQRITLTGSTDEVAIYGFNGYLNDDTILYRLD